MHISRTALQSIAATLTAALIFVACSSDPETGTPAGQDGGSSASSSGGADGATSSTPDAAVDSATGTPGDPTTSFPASAIKLLLDGVVTDLGSADGKVEGLTYELGKNSAGGNRVNFGIIGGAPTFRLADGATPADV